MRQDLDCIKVGENGFLESLNLENLALWGTQSIIGILEGALKSIEESEDIKEVDTKGYHLVEAALERAKDFDACIHRLADEQRLRKNRSEPEGY